MLRRATLVIAATAMLGFAAGGTPALAASDHDRSRFPGTFSLPDGFQPEGIAIGPGPFAYFGSLADGDIYRADLRSGEGEVISQGPDSPSVGLKTDRTGRLFVAGGAGGDARVVDTRTGDVLADYQFAETDTFVNDVVLTKDAAWFTDSMRPFLYKLPLEGGRLPGQEDVVRLPITGDFVFEEGFNANGLVSTPDRSALLVVKSSTGELFRVDPETGDSTLVDLGDTVLTNGDGLLLLGRTLYVVQNRLNQVAVLRMASDGSSGRLVDTLTHEGFDVPTTVAAFGSRLYLPNARFGIEVEPTTPYTVNAISRC